MSDVKISFEELDKVIQEEKEKQRSPFTKEIYNG